MPAGLRVLHAIHDFLPRHQAGSELYAAALCEALAAGGHHPTILCAEYDPARADGEITWRAHAGIPVVEVVNNWRVRSFAETYRPPSVTEALRHVLDATQPHVLHVHNLLNLSFDLPRQARARRIPTVATLHDYTLVCPSGGQRVHVAERHRCDAIDPERCARCFPSSPWHAQMAFARIPRASSWAGAPTAVRWLQQRAPRLLERAVGAAARAGTAPIGAADIRQRLAAARQVFDDVDVFVAPSAALAREFRQLGLAGTKVEVSDYGFPPLAPAERQPRDGPLRIGFVGTLVWHKGPDVLIEALRLLPRGVVRVEVVGDADVSPGYAADLRARAAGLPVRFHGRAARGTLAGLYASFDVLVVPSRWLENSPLVIHEAFQAGLPVIGSRIGGIPDLIAHEVNGLLVDPDAPPALARAVEWLLDDPARIDALRSRLPAVKSIAQDADEWIARYVRVRDAAAAVAS